MKRMKKLLMVSLIVALILPTNSLNAQITNYESEKSVKAELEALEDPVVELADDLESQTLRGPVVSAIEVTKYTRDNEEETTRFEVGEVVNFWINVENKGEVPLNRIYINDPMLDIAWIYEDVQLDVGENIDLKIGEKTFDIGDEFLEKQLTNGVCVVAYNLNDQRHHFFRTRASDCVQFVIYNRPEVDLIKTSVDSEGSMSEKIEFDLLDNVWYKFDLKNTGTVLLSEGLLTDEVLGVNAEIGDMPEGFDETRWLSKLLTAPFVDDHINDEGMILNVAELIGNYAYLKGNMEVDPASDEATIKVNIPNLSLSKASYGSENADGTGELVERSTFYDDELVTYVFTVKNDGDTDLKDVRLYDEMLFGDTAEGYYLVGTMAPGAEEIVTKTYQLQSVEGQMCLENFAEVKGYKWSKDEDLLFYEEMDLERESYAEAQTINKIHMAPRPYLELKLVKDADPEDYVYDFESISYDFIIENLSDVAVELIDLVDPMLFDGSYSLSSVKLDPVGGLNSIYTIYDVVLDSAGIEANINAADGKVHNTAMVHGLSYLPVMDCEHEASRILLEALDVFPPLAISAEDSEEVFVRDLAIEVVKTPEAYTYGIDEEVTIDFKVTNTGNIDFTNVLFEDLSLPDYHLISRMDLGQLPAGQTIEWSETVSFEEEGTYQDMAYVAGFIEETDLSEVSGPYEWGDYVPTDTDEAEIRVINLEGPAIELTKEAIPNEVLVGREMMYKFTVKNPGGYDLYNVRLVDEQLGLDIILDNLEAGTGEVIHYETVTYDEAGTVENLASVSGDYYGEASIVPMLVEVGDVFAEALVTISDEAEATLEVLDFAIDLTKTAVTGDGSTTEDTTWTEGDTVWYKFDLENIGDVTLYDVSLKDEDIDAFWSDNKDLAVGEKISLWLSEVYLEDGTYTNSALATGYLTPLDLFNEIQEGEDYPMPSAYLPEFVTDAAVEVITVGNPTTTTTTTTRTTRYDLIVSQVGQGSVTTGTFNNLRGTFNLGEVIPADGWEFVGWFGDDGDTVDGPNANGDYTVSMSRDKEVEAVFETIPQASPHSLNIVVTGEGNITSQVIDFTSTDLYTFGPLEGINGYAFINIGGPDGEELLMVDPVTYNLLVDGNKEIHVLFEQSSVVEDEIILDEATPLADPIPATGGVPFAIPIIAGFVTIGAGFSMKKRIFK